MNWTSILFSRMLRASKIEPELFREVEEDTKATMQSVIVILFTSLCAGVGFAISGLAAGDEIYAVLSIGIFTSVVGWFVWSFIVYILGTTIFKSTKSTASYQSFVRIVGFSTSPGILRLFIMIPEAGVYIDMAIQIWCIMASIIALKQALSFSTGRAAATCISGWIIYAVFLIGFFQLLGIEIMPPVS